MVQLLSAVASSDGFWDELAPLLDYGIRVVPIKFNARQPYWQAWEFGKIRKHGRYGSSSTTNRDRLLKVTESEIRPAIGVPQGQPLGNRYTLVLDVDAENGGLDSWIELCGRIGESPPSATVLTKTENCFHRWFLSSSQWLDAPKEIGPGLEVKRAGHLSIVPPTPGYVWAQAPWQGDGIWNWAELDAYLGLLTPQPVAAERQHLQVIPDVLDWEVVDDYLRAIASAEAGARTDALLRFGGKVAYATATGHGLNSPSAVEAALWAACRTNGMEEDYSADELERKIQVYSRWSDPAQNPLLLDVLPPSARPWGGEGAHLVITGFSGRGGESEKKVFLDLSRFARYEFKPYPVWWSVKSTGLGYEAVRGALARLETRRLIERGPGQANARKRATHTYRLTAKGRTLLNGVTP